MKTRREVDDDDSEDDVFEVDDFFNEKKKEIEVKDPHLVSKEISSVSFSVLRPERSARDFGEKSHQSSLVRCSE